MSLRILAGGGGDGSGRTLLPHGAVVRGYRGTHEIAHEISPSEGEVAVKIRPGNAHIMATWAVGTPSEVAAYITDYLPRSGEDGFWLHHLQRAVELCLALAK